ncbi:hypothetical protein ILP92_16975 [Maribius pontilimi]|uniref:Uncharacterized protein n=1 Tax=Palleronia pontilimi TaxID=1964209 RepID=A0A934MFE5_9RHOB|nr:hypothetical protein [Palleronia pontilimi]MBJ3764431.1 hypothetical protein [Palleronia pontilimi]
MTFWWFPVGAAGVPTTFEELDAAPDGVPAPPDMEDAVAEEAAARADRPADFVGELERAFDRTLPGNERLALAAKLAAI